MYVTKYKNIIYYLPASFFFLVFLKKNLFFALINLFCVNRNDDL